MLSSEEGLGSVIGVVEGKVHQRVLLKEKPLLSSEDHITGGCTDLILIGVFVPYFSISDFKCFLFHSLGINRIYNF